MPFILLFIAIAMARDAIMDIGIANIMKTVFHRYCQNLGSLTIMRPFSEWNHNSLIKLSQPTNFGGQVIISHL